MRVAKVVVTDLSGKGKKIFKHNDTVTEDSFPEGKFDKLIAGGFIKETVEEANTIEVSETVEILEEGKQPENVTSIESISHEDLNSKETVEEAKTDNKFKGKKK